jgi:hypothetical protein
MEVSVAKLADAFLGKMGKAGPKYRPSSSRFSGQSSHPPTAQPIRPIAA